MKKSVVLVVLLVITNGATGIVAAQEQSTPTSTPNEDGDGVVDEAEDAVSGNSNSTPTKTPTETPKPKQIDVSDAPPFSFHFVDKSRDLKGKTVIESTSNNTHIVGKEFYPAKNKAVLTFVSDKSVHLTFTDASAIDPSEESGTFASEGVTVPRGTSKVIVTSTKNSEGTMLITITGDKENVYVSNGKDTRPLVPGPFSTNYGRFLFFFGIILGVGNCILCIVYMTKKRLSSVEVLN